MIYKATNRRLRAANKLHVASSRAILPPIFFIRASQSAKHGLKFRNISLGLCFGVVFMGQHTKRLLLAVLSAAYRVSCFPSVAFVRPSFHHRAYPKAPVNSRFKYSKRGRASRTQTTSSIYCTLDLILQPRTYLDFMLHGLRVRLRIETHSVEHVDLTCTRINYRE